MFWVGDSTGVVREWSCKRVGKLHNARAILKDYREEGDVVFSRFKGGKEGTLWYYRALIDAFREAGTNRVLVDELDRVVTEMERL